MKGTKIVKKEQKPKIGKNCQIHPSAVIMPWVEMGDNCVIHEGAVLGSLGLMLARDANKNLIRKKVAGKVILGNNVDIGANACIHRGGGVLPEKSRTTIGDHTYIGSLVNIGHDCHIGSNVLIGPSCCLAGHVEVGDNVYIAPQTTIINRCKIGNKSYVGIGSLVLHNVPPNRVVYGRPAMPRKRQPKRYPKLP